MAMNSKKALALIFFSLFSLAAVFAQETAESVSIIRLIANPNMYQGRSVRVMGYVEMDFEGTAIYLTPSDSHNGLKKNGLWLEITDEQRGQWMKFDDKFCLIEGMFNGANQGHAGLWSGAVEDIARIDSWSYKEE